MNLPDKKWFEYNGHLLQKRIPLADWTCTGYEYPSHELQKFNNLLLNNQQYIKHNRILDLGCHSGYISFIAKHLGALSVTGLNARAEPIEVANYFFNQTETEGKFIVGDIEDFNLLKELCNTADTVIVSSILEHLRNPEYVIRTITDSNVQHILLESSVVDDSSSEPRLHYYLQDTEYNVNVIGKTDKALGCTPNQRFLEFLLYHHGWKITRYIKYDAFSADWFAKSQLDTVPFLRKVVVISATKFIK